ncbi:MAG: pyridoxal 5'-phosphate synthase glutaminase subunit PdxT [Methanomicrobiales archaeon]|nr:pyridoxal 5'-phosphate synthase glutaminase subunit PdxT [Methanomicrobiales archaeon]MDD1655692.1 pyridoxal 5'-phosphate synthase glutaminase subunit PdxT [Methanomicrobiales archaeon]
MGVRIGVLDLQGNVSEHLLAFREALALSGQEKGSTVVPIRSAAEIAGCDGLAIPGGESTTIARMVDRKGMRDPIRNFPGGIFATCAGLILLATAVEDDRRFPPLGILDVTVRRNAFGRQRESFEQDLLLEGEKEPFHAVFIRAPVITRTGAGVRVLAQLPQGAIAVAQGPHLGLAFHPELFRDRRLHLRFLAGLSV